MAGSQWGGGSSWTSVYPLDAECKYLGRGADSSEGWKEKPETACHHLSLKETGQFYTVCFSGQRLTEVVCIFSFSGLFFTLKPRPEQHWKWCPRLILSKVQWGGNGEETGGLNGLITISRQTSALWHEHYCFPFFLLLPHQIWCVFSGVCMCRQVEFFSLPDPLILTAVQRGWWQASWWTPVSPAGSSAHSVLLLNRCWPGTWLSSSGTSLGFFPRTQMEKRGRHFYQQRPQRHSYHAIRTWQHRSSGCLCLLQN